MKHWPGVKYDGTTEDYLRWLQITAAKYQALERYAQRDPLWVDPPLVRQGSD